MPSKKLKRITSQNYLKYYYDIPYEGKTSAGKPLRRLKNITCPYRGIKIIPSETIKSFEKGLSRCKTAEDYLYIRLTSCLLKNQYLLFLKTFQC